MNTHMIESKLSRMGKRTKASMIRDLLKTSLIEGIISFGGGVPDPDTFPREILSEIAKEVIMDEYKVSLQYGTTEGDIELRKQYIRYLEEKVGVFGLTPENILVTTGSQQALDLIARTFLDEGSICSVCAPVYLGAASAFEVRSPQFILMEMDDDGPDVDSLRNRLRNFSNDEMERFKFIYVVSNFDNPTGITVSRKKREQLLDVVEEFQLMLCEDDPYGALRYEGEPIPTIYEMAERRGLQDNVLLMNTFSKVLSPGLRLGIVVGNPEIIRRLVMGKQAADLCGSTLVQRLTARFMERYDFLDMIKPALKLYGIKKNEMMKAFDRYLAPLPGVKWTRPQGGLFSWVTVEDPKMDTMKMMSLAIENKVVYIPGLSFFVDGRGTDSMRLSYCLPSVEEIHEGTKRLVHTIEEYLNLQTGG